MACPNVNSPEWKSLVDTIGENNAWREFLKFGEIPNSSIYDVKTKPGVSEVFESNSELSNIGTQEQYSQYLDSIFPDSKVKDIVYHGANEPIEGENFTKREGATGGGIWFSGSKKYAQIQMDRAQPSESLIGRKLRGAPTMYQVILNIKKPKNFYNATGALLVQTPREFEKQYDKESNDAALFHHPNSKKPANRDSADQVVVFEPEQIHILGSKQDIEGFKKFVQSGKSKNVLYSIRTKTTEEISKGIDPELMKSDRELKYTSFIKSALINTLGDISPNKKLTVSPDTAFSDVKSTFEDVVGSLKMALSSFIKSDEDLQEIKKSSSYQEILENFPVIAWVNSYKEFQTALQTYSEIVNNFDRYREFVIAELAHEGIRLVKDRIELILPQDISNKEEDDTSDDTSLPAEEINTQKFDTTIFETNPYDTATLRVKALMQTIKTGEYELGIPLYADSDDVMADMLYAGSAMDFSGYTDIKNKLEVFKSQLELRKEGRPYIDDLLAKINQFEIDGQWETINQILTFASKAFANENLLLYKLQKQGTEVRGVSEIKTISSNRDKIEDQVARHFLAQHKASDFFRKTATGEFYPKEDKVKQLDQIRREGKVLKGQAKINKFIEFFNVLGVPFTNKDMEYIAPKLSKAIRKGQSFDIVFADGQFLDNIYKSFDENMKTAFKDDYGFQDEKSSMKAIAQLYYDANPGKYKIVSSKTADGKSKYLYIQPNYVEIQKREWDNSNDTSSITNTALAKPNESFWKKVKQAVYNFTLGYFNGSREQEKGKDGKVRKNFTKKEQMVTMLLKHQENMSTGTYILFTLSDKTTTVESKMTKEFFVDDKNSPVGLGVDYSIENGEVVYTPSFKNKVYNSFVEPEISRILAAIKHEKNINLENFNISSRLFYFLPRLNSDPALENFRKDLYSGTKSLEQLKITYGKAIADVVIDEFSKSSDVQIQEFKNNGILKLNEKTGEFSYPLFKNGFGETDYVNRFRKTGVKGYNLAHLMMMDMKFNYMNAQIKSVQFLKFDPMNAFKPIKGMNLSSFENLSNEDKSALVNSTWDEFSKRAAALVAPGSQGNWTWQYGNNKTYSSQQYNAVTVNDIGTITDGQEFVTMQEHIDYLMSEGKISDDVWESIHKKIINAGPGGYYTLSKKELEYVFTPVKPVHANNMKLGKEGEEDITGLNRVDYVKTSRYPLIPEQERGSERDKLRQWMERNNIQSLNFASGKKLGRPEKSLTLFDENGKFIEPSDNDRIIATQTLSRDGLRNQQEIPHQKDEIATITQMNRTLFDELLESNFSISSIKKMTGYEAKEIKEKIRSKLFDMEAEKLRQQIGDLNKSHRGIHRLLKDTIVNDTTGTYTENDLKSIELGEDGFFKMDIEFQFKFEKFQGLVNSMINKNVMLKVDGTSFVQVSGVGAKFNFSELSKGEKSGIIWTDSYAKTFKKDGEAKLSYIEKDEKGNVKPAQVIVSQYLRDSKGNLIDLTKHIVEKDNIKILDTSKFTPEMFQLVASRIPNQSHVSMLPVEVVGFLPEYMENTIVVPDGITDQMGSDFDVDKLYAYTSKVVASKNKEGETTYSGVNYEIANISDVDKLDRNQLEQLYRDLHWMVLTHPDAFDKITKSVDNPEVKKKVDLRKEELKKYNITAEATSNLPLDFMTSINRFTDNKSGKSGVSIFANLISAQADMQDKVIQLGVMEDGEIVDHPKPILIKLTKNTKDILNLKYIGKTGKSKSFINKKRSISDNLNILFTESADNAKNQFLREFGWDEKTMGAIGILEMFTDEKGRGVPIDFAMDLTSQPAMKRLSEKIEQKQDSFGEYDFNAVRSSITEIQNDIIEYVEKNNLLGLGKKAAEYFENPERDAVLDPETLSDMWLVGQAMSKPKEERDSILKQMVEDFNKKYGPKTYTSVNDLILKYFESQYDALNLFERLQDTGRELMTILGSVYTYTKGIGPNVFATKQKLEQLNKLAYSSNFVNIENIAGKVEKDDNGNVTIKPQGEIGGSIKNSLIFAQDLYNQLFSISTGKTVDDLAIRILGDQGTKKEEIGKQRYIDTFKSIFNAVKSYMYTVPNLELFDNVRATRTSLINGETSVGKRILDLLKQPEFSKNGFLKNIEVDVNYNGAHIISFRAPFGTEIDDKAAISGFYQLATHKTEEIRQLAKDLALYPFATGDAGNIGRFIPVDYYLSDKDFAKAMRNMADTFTIHMASPNAVNDLVQQIVQNNAETYAKNFTFSTSTVEGGTYNSLFKDILSPLIGNAQDLSKVKTLSFNIGNFERNKKGTGLVNALKVKLSDAELEEAKNKGIDTTDKFKYPPYILITDSYTSGYEMGNRSERYLYKRTSSFLDPVATYERVNILGYKNIKEYEFDNPELRSVIKDNAVDPVDEEMMPEEPDMSFGLTQEMFEQYEPMQPQVKTGLQPSDYTNHSGGAVGADTAWDAIGKNYGVVNHQHYYYGNKTPKGNVELTKAQVDEGIIEMKKAAVILNKNPQRTETINLLARNWFQVKNSDQIVAIAPIADDMKSVEGGTGWAVAMAQANNKEIHVFNQKNNSWYSWNGSSFIKSEVPILKQNFAGIGTRDLTPAGRQAIEDVYSNTFTTREQTIKYENGINYLVQNGERIGKMGTEGMEPIKDELKQLVSEELYNYLKSDDLALDYHDAFAKLSEFDKQLIAKVLNFPDSKFRVTNIEDVETNQLIIDRIIAQATSPKITEEDLVEKEGFTPDITEYKGTNYYVFGTEEDDMIVHAVRQDGKIGEIIKNKDLKNKVIIKKMEDTHPEWVVELTNLQYSPRYMVMPAGEVISLAPTNYGKQITSDDIYKRVMDKFNSKLEDKVVIEQKAPQAGEEKPTFTHNGITVPTEFKLSEEQETALKKMIDFVEQRSTPAGEYTDTYTLEGYAGTGKTSIVGVMESYMSKKNNGVSLIYMAPTHAATVALGLNVVKYGSRYLPMTVASSFFYNKEKQAYVFTKKFSDRAKGIKNVIILDEASMLKNEDFTNLIRTAQEMGYKIIFMGDPKQISEIPDEKEKEITSKQLAKAFSNPNKSVLTNVFRTKDNNILKILTTIRNNVEFEEINFESTDNLKQLKRGDYNAELIDDLKNNLEDVTIINYTNNGVFKINQEARRTLGFSGELKVGEKIVGYLGSQTKQIEKGHLANSVSYIVNEVTKSNNGIVTINCSSNLLQNLLNQGMIGFPSNITFDYYQVSSNDSLNFNLTEEQLQNNRNTLKDKLKAIHQLKVDLDAKRISYPTFITKVNMIRADLANYNTGNHYVYNPNSDKIELYDPIVHGNILKKNPNLKLEKGIDFGYAVTIHKSQGMTIPIVYFDTASLGAVKPINIIRDNKQFNTEKNALYYVGMSRASRKLVVPYNGDKKVTSSDKFSTGSQGEQFDLMAFRSKMNKESVTIELFAFENDATDPKKFLNTIYKTTSPLYKEILTAIGKAGGVGQLTFMIDRKMQSPGEYDIPTKTVKINPDLIVADNDSIETAREKMHEVIMHELLHHVTADLLMTNSSRLTAEQRKWVKSIENLFDDVQKKILADPKHREALLRAIEESNKTDGILSASDKSMYYGLTNKYDFISMLMTDNSFREFMNNTKYEGNKSILDRFIDILTNILKALGIQVKEDSVLKEGVTSIVGLIQSRQGMEFTADTGSIQKSILTSTKGDYVKDNFDDIIEMLNIKTVC